MSLALNEALKTAIRWRRNLLARTDGGGPDGPAKRPNNACTRPLECNS